MKTFGFIMSALLALAIVGCGLDAATEAKLVALGQKNDALLQKGKDIAAQVKAGTLDPAAAIQTLAELQQAISANAAEIKAVRDQAGSGFGTTAQVLVLLFGRSLLHLAGSVAPEGSLLATALTFLLGGSQTKPSDPTNTAKPAAA